MTTVASARASRAPLTARLDGREPTDRCMNEAAEISEPRCLQEIQNPASAEAAAATAVAASRDLYSSGLAWHATT